MLKKTYAYNKIKSSPLEIDEQYKNIFTHLEESILVVDNKRRIINCNPAFTKLFGYSLSEMRSKQPYFVYKNKQEYEKVGELIKASKETQMTIPEITFKKKNGDFFPGEVLFSLLKNASNEPLGFMGIVRDITERKRQLQKNELLLARAKQEGIMMRNEFLNSASHELKTPLTSLQLQLQLLDHMADMSQGISESDIRQCITVSERQVKHLSYLINNLLDVSSVNSQEFSLWKKVK